MVDRFLSAIQSPVWLDAVTQAQLDNTVYMKAALGMK
jgi:hypothetical protein